MKLPFEQTEGLWLALCPCVAAFRQDAGTIASIEITKKKHFEKPHQIDIK